MQRLVLLTMVMIPAIPLHAQSSWAKHNFTLGGGAAIPRDGLEPYFDTAGAFRFAYGFRFLRNFQADAGVDVAFQAAGVDDYYYSYYGPLRIRDYQYFVPLGGRIVLPFARERVQFYAGGGGAYLRYSEIVTQPFGEGGFRVECPPCRARSGWGYYGLAGGSVALDRGNHFRMGGGVTVYRATTSGDSFGALPRFETRDRWINALMEFTFSF
jgi:hypothetical protein